MKLGLCPDRPWVWRAARTPCMISFLRLPETRYFTAARRNNSQKQNKTEETSKKKPNKQKKNNNKTHKLYAFDQIWFGK